MKKLILAAAMTAFAAGAAVAQEAPYTVMNGQVKYPGQMQWNAPAADYYGGNTYYGGASATIPGGYADAPAYYGERPHYNSDSYNQSGPGVFIFDGQNINQDQDYSGR